MGIWETYQSRADAHGDTKRTTAYNREVRMLLNKTKDNLSYQTVMINDDEREVSIINSDNLNEKAIISLPNEDLRNGSLVRWMDNYWLITERDANTTIYTKCKMIQCNHLLKWVSGDGVIHEQWCVIEDGTKYLTGEFEDRNFIVTRGDSRIAMTIAKNEFTEKFDRECRFLIDDPDSPHKLAYILSKPLKLGGVFNNDGCYKFVLQEVTATEDDNHELGIADYYKYFPKNGSNETTEAQPPESTESTTNNGKKVWL